MPYINEHLVGKFFSEEHTGRKPFFWEYFTNQDYVRDYNARLSEITRDLNRHKNSLYLVPYLQENYGFSWEKALKFSQANTDYNWKTGSIEDRKAMLIEANNQFANFTLPASLEELIKVDEETEENK